MDLRHLCKARLPIFGAVALAFALTSGAALAQPVPFSCTGEAFIVQDRTQGKLFVIDQSITPFDLDPLGDANNNSVCDPGEDCNLDIGGTPIEANNLGFRTTDGLLYAVQVDLTNNTNSGIIQIDSNGDVFSLGNPTGAVTWPTNSFNAGDVSTDGTVMYVNQSGRGPLHRVVLPALTFTTVNITGFTGVGNVVLDWAYHPDFPPASALLFGADRTGQIARLNPITGARTDFTVVGLPGTGANRDVDYGGAWFNAAGELFLFDNGDPDSMPPRDGQIFKVTITNPASATPTFTVSAPTVGENSIANDAAACVQSVVGAAKQMTSSNATMFPATITILYTFENFDAAQTLTLVSVIDDLEDVFGTIGSDWTFGSISSSAGIDHNPSFDGSDSPPNTAANIELIDQAGDNSLDPSTTETVTVTINLLNGNQADINDEFCNQVRITGFVGATQFEDLSTDGLNPDPDNNGSPDEATLSCIMQTPVELMTFEIE